jgi:hypothetical protein
MSACIRCGLYSTHAPGCQLARHGPTRDSIAALVETTEAWGRNEGIEAAAKLVGEFFNESSLHFTAAQQLSATILALKEKL